MYLSLSLYIYIYLFPDKPLAMVLDPECSEYVPEKTEHGNLGNKAKTINVLNMPPQAKPLCSRDLYRNSE